MANKKGLMQTSLLEQICDCSEIQNGHNFKVGDYIYDNGMMHIFSYGASPPGQCSGYIWDQCANRLQRIPTKKELIRFARNKEKRLEEKGECTLETYVVKEWYNDGYFYLDSLDQQSIFSPIMRGIANKSFTAGIYNKGKKPGWFHVPIPSISYFYIWIPSQEQIQDILKAKWDCTKHNIRRAFYTWYRSPCCENKQHWTDQELWITFYLYILRKKKGGI